MGEFRIHTHTILENNRKNLGKKSSTNNLMEIYQHVFELEQKPRSGGVLFNDIIRREGVTMTAEDHVLPCRTIHVI